ncbi:hypothetical protein ACVWZZ_005680 [Bradyrhizobium sp. LM6.10]
MEIQNVYDDLGFFSRHERKPHGLPKGEAGTEPHGKRSRGRSQVLLYNDARPHSRLGWNTPSEFSFTCHPRWNLAQSSPLTLRGPVLSCVSFKTSMSQA